MVGYPVLVYLVGIHFKGMTVLHKEMRKRKKAKSIPGRIEIELEKSMKKKVETEVWKRITKLTTYPF